MNKTISLIAALLIAASSFAQDVAKKVSFVPSVGINYTNFTDEGQGDPKIGFVIGGEFHFPMSKPLDFSTGLFFDRKGCKDIHSDYSISLNCDYLEVPLLLNAQIAKGLRLKAGLQPGILLNSSVTLSQGKVSASVKTGEYFKTFDLIAPLGFSYEFHNIVIDARYNIGLTNVRKDNDYNETGRNIGIQLMLGYRF